MWFFFHLGRSTSEKVQQEVSTDRNPNETRLAVVFPLLVQIERYSCGRLSAVDLTYEGFEFQKDEMTYSVHLTWNKAGKSAQVSCM